MVLICCFTFSLSFFSFLSRPCFSFVYLPTSIPFYSYILSGRFIFLAAHTSLFFSPS